MSTNKILTEYWQEEDLKLVDLYELTLKETTKVMPTANIDISDRLINSQIGTANSQDICHSKRPKANNNIH